MTRETFTAINSDQFVRDTYVYLRAVRRPIAAGWGELPFGVAAYNAVRRQ
jgi:hypothetical protein